MFFYHPSCLLSFEKTKVPFLFYFIFLIPLSGLNLINLSMSKSKPPISSSLKYDYQPQILFINPATHHTFISTQRHVTATRHRSTPSTLSHLSNSTNDQLRHEAYHWIFEVWWWSFFPQISLPSPNSPQCIPLIS